MAEFKSVAIADILIPERLREVDEDQALILSTQIAQQGLINDITIRRTPPATKPFRKYTLVAGAHRLRAHEILRRTEIDAKIVEADALDALLIEIAENLIRNELTALDRAIHVLKYREVWEEKHGKINPKGGRPKNSVKLTEFRDVNVLDAIEAMEGSTFFEHAAKRLGIHRSGVERAQLIGQKLAPELRKALKGSPVADNQSQLIKLAGMEPTRQKKIARAFAKTPDIGRAIDLTDANAKAKDVRTAQQTILSRLIDSWDRADEKTKTAFLQHVGRAQRAPRNKLPKLSDLINDINQTGEQP